MASTASEPKPLVVGVIVFDGVMQMDFIGPTMFLEQLPRFGVPVTFTTISLASGPLRSSSYIATGLPLYATTGYQDMHEHIDILVVPGGVGRVEVQKDAKFLAFLKAAAEKATYVLTVCTGSAILADTGFLDGRNATTNKIRFHEIAEQFPAVQWVHKARWVVDGNVWTASGVTAGIDMGHAFIAAVYGAEAATSMAEYAEISQLAGPDDDPFATDK